MLTLCDIWSARQRIGDVLRPTPLLSSPPLGRLIGGEVQLKPECLQETGSFKIRGAVNKIRNLGGKVRRVVACSSGNHGQATAFAAQQAGIAATIVVPHHTARNKIEAIRAWGAETIVWPGGYDAAEAEAKRLSREEGMVLVHPFDDPWIIEGQGTIGLEILEEWPNMDTVIVPLSGGGLITGIGLALKTINPCIQVIGVSQERSPVMYHSLQAGHPITLPDQETLADALVGGIDLANRYTFSLVQRYVDQVYLVSEAEVAQAIRFLLSTHHLVVEGGGAVGVAALLASKIRLSGRNAVCILSGGNIDLPVLANVLDGQDPRPTESSSP